MPLTTTGSRPWKQQFRQLGKRRRTIVRRRLYKPLLPAIYTAILAGKNSTSGAGLVEVYDRSPASSTAQLSNISSRGHVGTGTNVMIGGFISAVADTQVIVRKLGPTLTQFGVAGALADPRKWKRLTLI